MITNKKMSIVKGLLRRKQKIDRQIDEILCNQCGECCHRTQWLDEETIIVLDEYCDKLEWRNGKAYCKLYPHHHGYKIGEFEECVPIQDVVYRPKNCPYNLIYPLKYNAIKKSELK